MWVQHLDNVKELGVANDGHRPTTACNPADSECAQSLAFVHRTGGKGVHELLPLRLNVVSWAAHLHVFDEVAGGVGSGVARYSLPTPVKKSNYHDAIVE